MRSSQRSIEPQKQLRRLEKKHAAIKEQIHELEDHTHLTPQEQMQRLALKKQKLAMKDEIESIRRNGS